MKRIYVFFIISILLGCNTNYALIDGTMVSKKEIKEELILAEQRLKISTHYNSEKIKVIKLTKEWKAVDKVKYDIINNLKIGELSKANKDSRTPFFYVKIKNGSQVYHDADMINVFKPENITNRLFMKEVDRVIGLLERGVITLDDLNRELNAEYGIRARNHSPWGWTKEEVFLPDLIEVLARGNKYEVYKSELARGFKSEYISLIQNIGKKKNVETLAYYKITLK